MLTETVDGETRAQLLDLLGAEDEETVRTTANAIWRSLYTDSANSKTLLANSLWLSEGQVYKTETVERLANDYYASVFSAPMGTGDTNKAVQAWLNTNTGGLLADAAKNIETKPQTVMLLLSALYFKDRWSDEFYDGATSEDTFTAADGDIAAVLGPNGVGKSTLFRCVLGFLAPSEGGILVNGKDMRTLDRRAAAREIAYIPQSCVPSFNYTLLEVVMMGLTNRIGVFDAPRPEHKTAALEAMESLGIAHLAHRESGRVSGGERQLALLARAMVQNARVLVMDEPTANLDCGNSALVMERVSALAGEGFTVIFSTHDPNQAFRYATQVLALQGGGVLAAGRPEEALTSETLTKLYGVGMAVCPVTAAGKSFSVAVVTGGKTQ